MFRSLCRAKSRQRRCCFSLRSKEPLVFARGCDQILPAALLPRRFARRLLFGRLGLFLRLFLLENLDQFLLAFVGKLLFGRREHLLLFLVDMVEITVLRSEEHTSALQSLMRTSYAVFCL